MKKKVSLVSAVLAFIGFVFLFHGVALFFNSTSGITGFAVVEDGGEVNLTSGIFIIAGFLFLYLSNRRKQKGQAALEFLMTYGWAVLVAIIVIGVLAYFGVFSPGKFAPEAVVVNPPFYANAWSVNEDGVSFELKNNGGVPVFINYVRVVSEKPEVSYCEDFNYHVEEGEEKGREVDVGESFVANLDCSGLEKGKSFKGDIIIAYMRGDSGLVQYSRGVIGGVAGAGSGEEGGEGLECVGGCDDENACTTDSCNDGVCSNTLISCNDNNQCTTDSCNSASGCVYDNTDGVSCNNNLGVCQSGSCQECQLTNAYWSETSVVEGTSVTLSVVGANCEGKSLNFEIKEQDIFDDDDIVTLTGNYPSTSWTATWADDGGTDPEYYFIASLSGNANIKVTSGLLEVSKFVPSSCPVEGCSDNDVCNGVENCFDGACQQGTPLTCTDADACTVNACDPLVGCTTSPLSCNDNNQCTIDYCNSASGCVFTPRSCNDGNECTIDSCNSASGCINTPTTGASCSGGSGTCNSAGQCVTTPSGESNFVINLVFTGGELANGGSATSGGGNTAEERLATARAVVEAAAADWSEQIRDSNTMTIYYSFWSMAGNVQATTTGYRVDPNPPNRLIEATIRFNEAGAWFLDQTPDSASEWQTPKSSSADLGGGLINTGRWYIDPTGPAQGKTDLLSVARHEMGHALGYTDSYPPHYTETFFDHNIVVTTPRPYHGSVIKVNKDSTNHLDYPNTLMTYGFGGGKRYDFSDIDVLGLAQVAGYSDISVG